MRIIMEGFGILFRDIVVDCYNRRNVILLRLLVGLFTVLIRSLKVPFFCNIGYDNIYVNENIVLSKNGVIIPPKLYKIIKCNTGDKAYASGFTFLNSKTEDNSKNLSDFEE